MDPAGHSQPISRPRAVVLIALATLVVTAAIGLVTQVHRAGADRASHSVATPTRSATRASSAVYPREVPVSSITDSTLRTAAQHATPPVWVLVELAPGVYANRRPGPLGTVDDYTAVFGRCADLNRYSQAHHVSRAC